MSKDAIVDDVISVSSPRGSMIPAGVVIPKNSISEQVPMVIMFHGMLGEMNEGGLFYGEQGMAQQLCSLGIASVRLNFPGTGRSEESFEKYTINNMLEDACNVFSYGMEEYNVDRKRIGVLGFSMGAKVASLFIQKYPESDTVVLWSPAVGNSSSDFELYNNLFNFDPTLSCTEFVNGIMRDAYNDGKVFVNQHAIDEDIYLTKDFFEQLKDKYPADALRDFRGNLLMLMPIHDSFVPKSTYSYVIKNVNMEYVILDCDHELGAPNSRLEENPGIMRTAVDITSAYFYKKLVGEVKSKEL